MILEAATLNVIPGQEATFEEAMGAARPLIAATPGFISLNMHRSVETPNRYLLLVAWRALEDHTVGFRQSSRYGEWRNLLHHFYDPFPTVEHYADSIILESSHGSNRRGLPNQTIGSPKGSPTQQAPVLISLPPKMRRHTRSIQEAWLRAFIP